MKSKLPAETYLNTWINRELEALNPKAMNQEDQGRGLDLEVSQNIDGTYSAICPDDTFVRSIGTWAPVIVQRQIEKDYLEALALILGKDVKNFILLNGVDESVLDTPPTYVRIPDLKD